MKKPSKKELNQLTNRLHKTLENLERSEKQFLKALDEVQIAGEEILGFADELAESK